VKLNFLVSDLGSAEADGKVEKFSIQRGLRKRDSSDGSGYFNEYIINENYERPLLYEEYKHILDNVYDLDIQEFMIFQN
jgi:hypothetical protein